MSRSGILCLVLLAVVKSEFSECFLKWLGILKLETFWLYKGL